MVISTLLSTTSHYCMLQTKKKKEKKSTFQKKESLVSNLQEQVSMLSEQLHITRIVNEDDHQKLIMLSKHITNLERDVQDLIEIFKTNKNWIDLSPEALEKAKKEANKKLANTRIAASQVCDDESIEFANKFLSNPCDSSRAIFTDIVPEQIHIMIKAIKDPERFKLYVPSKRLNLFLYGPPGGGKTTIARYIARETDRLFFNITSAQMQGTFVSEGAKKLTLLLTGAYNIAKQNKDNEKSKAIIFIDEIDALLPERKGNLHHTAESENNKAVAAFLGLVNGFSEDITNRLTIIGATNRPDHVDQAVKDRLGIRIEIKPTREQQLAFIKSELALRPKIAQPEISDLIKLFSDQHTSLRTISTILDNAGMKAFSKDTEITIKEVKQAIEQHII